MESFHYAQQILNEPNVFCKIDLLNKQRSFLLDQKYNQSLGVGYLPARDVEILHPKYHSKKPGFSTAAGQARMLHDLASIELQAMELGLRTMTEFAESAPEVFKIELLDIIISESNHLRMCLIEIEKLGFKWGDWPVHLGLWNATSSNDNLLDRILIVHRYLEGSGLDAGDTLLRRLYLIDCPSIKNAVHQITTEEVGHVYFGSDWYRKICKIEKIDPSSDYILRMNKLLKILPKRLEPLATELRKKAGFDDHELQYLNDLRLRHLNKIE